MTTRIACSPLTGRIHRGRVNAAGTFFVGTKEDVTSDVLRAVIEKPCPFCGAVPLLYDLLDTHGGFSVKCPTDGCDTEKMKRTKAEAAAAWNRRAALAQPAASGEPEPVAWRVPLPGCTRNEFVNGLPGPQTVKYWRDQGIELEYAYAAQPAPARVPLTDSALLDAFCVTPGIHQFIQAFKAGARFAERAHGITPAKEAP